MHDVPPGFGVSSGYLSRDDRTRVLYVIDQVEYSGAELMHLPVLAADSDPLLACPPGSPTEALARERQITTVPLTFRRLRHSGGWRETVRSFGRGLASAIELRRLLRNHPERGLLYATALRPGMVAGLAKIGLGRRAVWFVAGWMPPAPIRAGLRLIARLGCDLAVATSEAVARDFSGHSRRLADRTVTLYPGTDVERFQPGRARPGAPRAVIVGHLSPVKRTDLALDIAELVLMRYPHFELDVIGRAQFREEDFEFERRLRARVEGSPRLRSRVRFHGYATDVPAALAEAGLLLHCCPDEPFGIVLVEAMAFGLPVVAPGSAGPSEIVEDGVTGFHYPPGDIATAARLVYRLLDDEDMARRMGAAARSAAERRFSATRYVEEIDAVLAELARRSPSAAS